MALISFLNNALYQDTYLLILQLTEANVQVDFYVTEYFLLQWVIWC